ncbi:disulfide bond formation protein B [Deltaproteobacteria bacterium Smac51]|nr:disulfide bond formation protein B [Deltaproteobacteria bacterium Smac51]
MILQLWARLKGDFWGTLGGWQNQRPLWLAGGLAALSLEIFSVAFFQKFLKLYPCELCVYIRFSMLAIFMGAMIAFINPRSALMKAAGYIVVIWGIIRGIIWDVALEMENLRAAGEHSVCSMNAPAFPFGLPLDKLIPSHFMPLALCGEDSKWSLFGLNMAEWLFFVYGVFALGILLMLVSWAKTRRR